jgi:hypothetical protein
VSGIGLEFSLLIHDADADFVRTPFDPEDQHDGWRLAGCGASGRRHGRRVAVTSEQDRSRITRAIEDEAAARGNGEHRLRARESAHSWDCRADQQQTNNQNTTSKGRNTTMSLTVRED